MQGDVLKYMEFYEYFTTKCKEIGKTPSEVARHCGFNPAAVSGWKNGKKPTQRTINIIRTYFKEPEQTAEETAKAYLFGNYRPTSEEWKLIIKMCDIIKNK